MIVPFLRSLHSINVAHSKSLCMHNFHMDSNITLVNGNSMSVLLKYFIGIHKTNGFKWWQKVSGGVIGDWHNEVSFVGFPRAGVDRLQSMGQIWFTLYFCKYSFIGTKPQSFFYVCLWLLTCYIGRVDYLDQKPSGLQGLWY